MAEPKFESNRILRAVLFLASSEERHALTGALGYSSAVTLEAVALQEKICACAGHGFSNAVRGEGLPYCVMLFDAAKALKVNAAKSPYLATIGGFPIALLDRLDSKLLKGQSGEMRLQAVDGYVDEMERKILAHLMVAAYECATPQQKALVDAKLAELKATPQGKQVAGLSTSAALLVIGNLGGFATYTAMSTVLSAISLGTLGFGAYAFASSLLSVVLGPAGWLALGAYGIAKVGAPKEAEVIRLAATCAMTSQRLRDERRRQSELRLG